ncbi:MAG: hypothetical protein JNK82_18125, partial [Myxococcaceae bacterium]|nr:hypothetical protein [Myxococcaceae bacterium]
KAKAESELKRARDELAQHAQAVEAERSSGFARSAETTRLLEAERARRGDIEGKLEQLAAENASLSTRMRELEPMLDQARKHVSGLGQAVSDLAAARARIDTLEKALTEEKQKSARLSNRERELRQLVAAISAKGDDVVVMDDGVQQTVETPSSPPQPAVSASPQSHDIGAAIGDVLGDMGDVPSGGTLIMNRLPAMPQAQGPLDPFADNFAPGQTLVQMTMPEEEDDEPTVPGMASAASIAASIPPPAVTPAPAPAPVGLSESLPVDVDGLDVDVDTDWGGQAMAIAMGPGPGQQDFLDRLRKNDKLVRRPSFFEYAAEGTEEEHVIGSLMGGDRYEDLKVLARGQCSPEQLESHLLKFHQLGLIGFDA